MYLCTCLDRKSKGSEGKNLVIKPSAESQLIIWFDAAQDSGAFDVDFAHLCSSKIYTASRIINMICTRPKSNTKVKQRMPYLRERCSIISCLCDLRMQTCINLGFGPMIERIFSHQNVKVEFKCMAVVALNIPKNKCHLTPKKFKNRSWGWPSRPPRSDPSKAGLFGEMFHWKSSFLLSCQTLVQLRFASLGIVRLQCTVLGCKMIWTFWVSAVFTTFVAGHHRWYNFKSISHHYNCSQILKSSQVDVKIDPTAAAAHFSLRSSMNFVWTLICPRMDLVYATPQHHDSTTAHCCHKGMERGKGKRRH